MPLPGVKFATLNEEQLKTLQALEQELGVYLLALVPEKLRLASLTPEQVAKVQEVEETLGVMLIAYQPQR